MWGSTDNLWESVVSFQQGIRLGDQLLYLLSHLHSPCLF